MPMQWLFFHLQHIQTLWNKASFDVSHTHAHKPNKNTQIFSSKFKIPSLILFSHNLCSFSVYSLYYWFLYVPAFPKHCTDFVSYLVTKYIKEVLEAFMFLPSFFFGKQSVPVLEHGAQK